eukprot:scaffold6735_cov124-Isochrysis_galbana.AAC.2
MRAERAAARRAVVLSGPLTPAAGPVSAAGGVTTRCTSKPPAARRRAASLPRAPPEKLCTRAKTPPSFVCLQAGAAHPSLPAPNRNGRGHRPLQRQAARCDRKGHRVGRSRAGACQSRYKGCTEHPLLLAGALPVLLPATWSVRQNTMMQWRCGRLVALLPTVPNLGDEPLTAYAVVAPSAACGESASRDFLWPFWARALVGCGGGAARVACRRRLRALRVSPAGCAPFPTLALLDLKGNLDTP